MTEIQFKAMPTEVAAEYWAGGADAYGNQPERAISDGNGVPCRHCLQPVGKDEAYLILSYRPFPGQQAYAETGPIFLHASPCQRYPEVAQPPAMFARRPQYLMRAYNADHRIVYGTGEVIAVDDMTEQARHLLANPEAAYLHLRSGGYNCFLCRIDRAG